MKINFQDGDTTNMVTDSGVSDKPQGFFLLCVCVCVCVCVMVGSCTKRKTNNNPHTPFPQLRNAQA